MDVGTFDSLIGGILKLLAIAAIIGVGYLAQKWARSRIAVNRSIARVQSAAFERHRKLAADQAVVIDAVITELASRPETYATFPPDLYTQLSAVHDRAGENERALH